MLKDRILERVRRNGSLSFEAYMEMCLYDPDEGFFAAGDVRPGPGGDFLTSPEVSPWFGRLVGRWVAPRLREGTSLVEMGAGSGSLLGPLLDELGERGHTPTTFAAERSAHARAELAAAFPTVAVVDRTEGLPVGGHAVVIMNEVLDNVPCALVDGRSGRWEEVRIVEAEGSLGLEATSTGERPRLEEWCDRFLGAPRDALLTAQTGAMHLIDTLVRRFDEVSFCVIDYGASTSELAWRPRADVVRAFRGHQTGFDWLETPGAVDITVEVNTDCLAAALPEPATVESQRAFLGRLGGADVVAGLTESSRERARDGDVMGQLVLRSEASGVRALMDPQGLGGFVVVTT